MGVIKRQGIKGSLINYFGVFIGFFGTLFIYPKDQELSGLIKYWLGNAGLILPFLTFGLHSIVTKFYPSFKAKFGKGYITFLMKVAVGIILPSTVIMLLIKYGLEYFIPEKTFPLFKDNVFWIQFALCILIAGINIFRINISNYLKIIIPGILENVGLKAAIIFAVLGSIYLNFSLTTVISIVIGFHAIHLITLIVYNYKLNPLDFKPFKISSISKSSRNEMISYWTFSGLNIFGTYLAFQIDTFMIGSYIGHSSITIYQAFLMMSNVIITPARSLLQITSPVLSTSFEKKDYDNIKLIYLKSSLNLITLGCFIFGTIWFLLPEIMEIMSNGEDYKPFMILFSILGFGRLFDLITSVNHQILAFSKWYKLNLPLLLGTSILNILLNYLLYKDLGIIGIAIATTTSLFIYNLVKSVFVYKLLKIHPLQSKMLILIIPLSIIFFLKNSFNTNYIFLTVLLKGITFSALFLFFLMKFNISEDLTNIIKNLYTKYKNKILG